ncbi:MAG TPA: hypothetical protein VLA28_09570, partial [Afifellaceae bacterium]|nr:hypothetical protein [Afifellaceae bacterium]
GWTRFKAAQDWLDANQRPALAGSGEDPSLQSQFTTFAAAQGVLSSSNISEREKNALFEEFLKWRNARQ